MNQSIKKTFVSIRKIVIRIIIALMSIATFFGVIYFFRFIGLKGVLGFTVGVLLTGFLFMSEHPFIVVYREMVLK